MKSQRSKRKKIRIPKGRIFQHYFHYYFLISLLHNSIQIHEKNGNHITKSGLFDDRAREASFIRLCSILRRMRVASARTVLSVNHNYCHVV